MRSRKEELPSSQHHNNRGRMNGLRWEKAVVYDCVERTVKVQNKKDIGRSHAPTIHSPALTKASVTDNGRCLKFDLPKRKAVDIFVDAETKSRPTLASMGAGRECNVLIATVYLDRCGITANLFRFFGLLSTLYLMKTTPWGKDVLADHERMTV